MKPTSYIFTQVTRAVGAAALLTFVSTAQAIVLFEQDFSSSTNVSDYISPGGTASGSLFNDISGPTGFTQSITGGALVMATGTGASGDEQGFRYTTGFGVPQEFLVIDYDLALDTTSNSAGQAAFIFGNAVESARPYSNRNNLDTNGFGLVSVKGGNALGSVQISANTLSGFGTPTFVPVGTLSFRVLMNNSGGSVAYTGPDGSSQTSLDNTTTVWYEDGGVWSLQPHLDNVAAFGNDLEGFRYSQTGTATSVTFDNIMISNIPEPGHIALVFSGLGLVLAVLVRRRRG